MRIMQRMTKNMADYRYIRKCDFCGAVIKTNRIKQRFCYPPKRCRYLWWTEEQRKKNQIIKLVIQHSKDIQKIKERLGLQ